MKEMFIIAVTAKKFNLKLTKPFSYFTATLKYLPYVLLIIKTDTKLSGFGEVAVAWDVTGETQKGVWGILPLVQLILLGKRISGISDVEGIMREINKNIYGNSALKAGVEMALLDLLGKAKRQPVYRLLNGRDKKYIIPQKVFSYEEITSSKLEGSLKIFLKQGLKILKIKAGQDTQKDIKTVYQIAKLAPKLKIVLDVNQGWRDLKKAISVIKEIKKAKNIAWIEQPICYQDYEGLHEIRRKTKIPIMVDESCHNLLDLKNLYKSNALDLVNIKLAKCGGVLEMLKMIKFCEAHSLKYMLGDMISSFLGTAANLHAATLGNFVSYDITFPERIKNDPFYGLKFEPPKVFIPQTMGLGVKTKK